MKEKMKNILARNWGIIVGILAVITYIYIEQYVCNGYKLSFTNFLYSMLPGSSYQVSTDGPLLSDVIDSFLPDIFSTIKNGIINNFWNSKSGLGTSTDLWMLMYPLNYIYVLPLDIAMPINSCLQFLIGFIGVYLLLREYECNKISASIGGAIYTFSSSLVMWHGWPHSDVAIWAPFAFLAYEKYLKTFKIRYVVEMTVFIYLMLVSGMPTFAAYFLYLLGFYVIYSAIKKFKKHVKEIFTVWAGFGISCIISIGISFPYTIELITSVGANGYADSRIGISEISLGIQYITTTVFPYIRSSDMTLHMNECTVFSGTLAILMLSFTLVNQRSKKNIRYWMYAIIIVATLIFTPALNFIYTKMPAINTSIKFRIIVLFNFLCAIICGLNLNDILVNYQQYRDNIKKIIIPLIFSGSYISFIFYEVISKNSYETYKVSIVYTLIFVAVYVITLLSIIYNKRLKRICILMLLITAIFEMAFFAKKYLPWIDRNADIIPAATDSIQYLQNNTVDMERIVSGGDDWSLFPSSYYNLYDINGHNFVYTNQDMKTYYSSISSSCFRSATRVKVLEIDNLNLTKYLGVRYIVETDQEDELLNSETNLVYVGDDGLVIYENTDYADRFELIENVNILQNSSEVLNAMSEKFLKNTLFLSQEEYPEAQEIENSPLDETEGIEVTEYSNDYIKLEVTNNQERYLLLNDYYSSDWNVYINGEKADLIKGNYLMRAVYLSETGTNVIEFRYEPAFTYKLLVLCVIFVLLLIALFLLRHKIERLIQKNSIDIN